MVQIIARASAALMFFVVAVGAYQSQTLAGDGDLRWGLFGQGAFLGLDVKRTNPATFVTTSQDTRASGFSYGASVGYDWMMDGGNFIGIEADVSLGELTKRLPRSRFDMDFLVSIRGRAGTHVGDDWMVYGTAGIAFLGLENAPAPLIGVKNQGTMTGGIVGVGAEYEWEHMTFFGEYLFAAFESWKFGNSSGFYDTHPNIHMLRAGIRFGSGHNHYHDED